MGYQIFNPLTGVYVFEQTLHSAKIKQKEIIDNFINVQRLFSTYTKNDEIDGNKLYANEFAAIHLGVGECEYVYTVFNATINEIISRVYCTSGIDGMYYIKVANNSVTEWVKVNGEYNGKSHLFVALSIEDGNPIEYYDIDGSMVVTKYDLDGNAIVQTIMSGFESIPEDKKHLLDSFAFKDCITAWSNKTYGFIVEFFELKPIPYDQCNQEQKAYIDNQKQIYINNNISFFSVSQETLNQDGSSTWVTVTI
jgi:hypothetical protein